MAYSSITKPSNFFNTKLYAGNGNAGNAQTGVGFQPDFVWLKSRTNTEYHNLYDAVRGVTKRLVSNTTGAESTISGLTAFGTDGFTVGAADTANQNSQNFVAWNWKANGQGSSNTDGSINTTYTSANTTAGFSIVKWTGSGDNATVGHGLGVVPKMIIVKNTYTTDDWIVYHGANTSAPQTDYLMLNQTNATADSAGVWNDTAPTSSVFTVGIADSTNGNTRPMIAYCFAEKTGYSKFGSYTGNGSANGTFIYTGFKPAFVVIKGAISGNGDAAQSWELYDNKRLGYNVDNNNLQPNTASAESTADRLDIVSNGFKIRINSDGVNDTNSTYIYMAFAEEPFVASNFNPATAR